MWVYGMGHKHIRFERTDTRHAVKPPAPQLQYQPVTRPPQAHRTPTVHHHTSHNTLSHASYALSNPINHHVAHTKLIISASPSCALCDRPPPPHLQQHTSSLTNMLGVFSTLAHSTNTDARRTCILHTVTQNTTYATHSISNRVKPSCHY